jgi:hypothetical protein
LQKKFLKSILSFLIIFLTLGLTFNHSHATQPPIERCNYQFPTYEDLIVRIQDKDLEINKELFLCLGFIETKALLIMDSTPDTLVQLNEDPRIQLFKDSYNKLSECFYPVEIPSDKSVQAINEAKLINSPGGKITLETYKAIESKGNNNCLIDTPHETCLSILEKQKRDNLSQLNLQIRNDLYGCHGNSSEPKNFLDSQSNEIGINNYEVFNEEKGLIANTQQKTQLKELTENQAGPVIGFINMIIDYLVGIVFVLCMASLIYGGYNLIFAGFDSDMTERGKNSIKYAITGFFFIMLSYTIVILVQSIF